MKHVHQIHQKFLARAGLAVSTLMLWAPAAANAQSADDIRKGVVGGSGSSADIGDVIRAAINIFSIVVGIAAVIIIIVAGLKYITSSGDSAKVNSAKDTILFAVIGLIVAAMAQILVRFVLTKV